MYSRNDANSKNNNFIMLGLAISAKLVKFTKILIKFET